jgi:hypothetical protein
MIAWALGTPRELKIQQLERFAREVMPAFSGERQPTRKQPQLVNS